MINLTPDFERIISPLLNDLEGNEYSRDYTIERICDEYERYCEKYRGEIVHISPSSMRAALADEGLID